MKRNRLLSILTLAMILLPAVDGFACTMVMAAKNGMVLAGNNEDWKNPRTQVAFLKSLGPQTGIDLYDRKEQGKEYRYLYRLSYGDTCVILRLSLIDGSRISKIDFHLE